MSFVPLAALLGGNQIPQPANDQPFAAPLVHRFKTESRSYAYDVNTGVILEVTSLAFELLAFFPQPVSEEELAGVERALDHRFSIPQIQKGFTQLKRMAEEFGLFKPIAIKTRMIAPEIVDSRVANISGSLGQLVLSVAEECNLRCNYCSFSGGYINTRVHNSTLMSWDIAQRCIEFFLARMRRAKGELTFYGGEPLINVALITKCMEYMSSRDSDVTYGLTTNGTLLSDEVVDLFAHFNVRTLISLDGPEEIHDKERRFVGGQGSFQRVLKNCRRMQERYPEYFKRRVKFWCTLRPEDDDESVVRFFAENSELFHGNVGFGKVASGHTTFATSGNRPSRGPSKLEQRYLDKVVRTDIHDDEFAILREMFEKPYIRLQYRPKSASGFGEETHAMGACFPGNYRVFVKADGTFQVCEKSNNSLIIGHIDRGFDFDRITDIYRRFYELHNRECRQCWAYRLCPSCYVSSTRDTGQFESALNPSYCANVRGKWTSYLENYCAVLERSPKGFAHASTLTADRIPVLDD